jgi:putative Mg2+ transporter-C (MgtC) family protein
VAGSLAFELVDPDVVVLVGKLALGAVLGGLIGLERVSRGHSAGVRTQALVVMGTTLFGEVSIGFGGDPSRVAAQVVTGIGFLGAGTIMRHGVEIRGLTTAASIWTAAAIGLAVSLGGDYLWVAMIATLFALAVLSLLSRLESRYKKVDDTEMVVLLDERSRISAVVAELEERGAEVNRLRVISTEPECEIALQLRSADADAIASIVNLDGVREARWLD